MATTTRTDNPKCPDFWSHYENAADELVPGHGGTLDAGADRLVLRHADREYASCEGHQ